MPIESPLVLKQTAIWVDPDGTSVRICDMTDSRLQSAIQMLAHAGQVFQAVALVRSLEGDTSGESMNRVLSRGWEDYVPAWELYNCLCRDARRRGIRIDVEPAQQVRQLADDVRAVLNQARQATVLARELE